MNLSIAGLSLSIYTDEVNLSLDYSPCHKKFVAVNETLAQNNLVEEQRLVLDMLDIPISPESQFLEYLCKNEIWELWVDTNKHFVFTQPNQEPQRWVIIDPEFKTGKIMGDFSRFNQSLIYPLQYIDIVIYSNWLANFGDIILHASGFSYNSEGYCFIGDSGAGKSTLIRDISNQPGVTVLGEDQLILRKIEDQFIVFGTPWHETPEMCSPIGVPLKKVFFLDRNASQVIASISDFDAVVKIVQTAFFPVYRPDGIKKILERLSSLAGNVRFYLLAYERGTNVLQVIVDD